MGPVPPDELEQLLAETNFTQREIETFYKYSNDDDGNISKEEFATLCFDQGIVAAGLVERMWVVFDRNNDGTLTYFELVKSLSPLLRGEQADVAGLFYDLYEVDGDGDLTEAEIVAVYSDMIHITQQVDREGLTAAERKRIREWVKEHRSDDGTLDRDTFIEAISEMEAHEEAHTELRSFRTFYFVFLISFFEMGTSFSLPAMGALSERIKLRFDIGDQEIGTLTSAYFFAAMVGPLVGGLFMDKVGPVPVIIGANIIVTLGAIMQASASGKDQFALLLVGRLFLGFGGEITPFTTVETLGRLFPDYLGLMAGIRNLVQSISGFLAFVLLPIWADAMSDEPLDNDGTSFALWMCAVLGGVSLLASVIVFFSMKKESNVYVEEQSDQQTVINSMRALAKATVPRLTGIQRWTLPLSFFFAIYGIKSQYFAPFGLLGPIMGPLSDKYGRRSLSLAFVTTLSMIGFGILAISSGGSTSVWIASMLFALQYGFGDTVAYISIRFIVGVSRAGIGYGVYGIIGNLIATVVPIIGGTLMDQDNGEDKVLWYFTGLMAIGAASWVMVFILEGPRSLLELPANKVIETSDEDIKMAALTYVVGRTGTNKDTEEEKPNTPEPTNTEAAPLVWSDHENVTDDNDVEASA
eukprot:scaffold78526_cov59-Attheya_sp.AAC.4